MRGLSYGLLGLLVVVVVGLFVAPFLIDWSWAKRDIADAVKAETGRELTIAGKLDLALLPTPHLKAEGVKLSNLPGAAVPDMVRVKSLNIDVRLWPLLSGRIEASSVRLVEPVIELERLTDGRVNWDLSPAPAVSQPQGDSGFAFGVDRLVIVDGTAIYRDAAAKQIERAEHVNVEVGAASLDGPFRIAGKLAALGVPATIDARIGQLGSDKPIPVSLRLGVSGLVLDFGGTLADAQTKPRLEGKLKGTSDNLARAMQDPTLPKALAGKLALTADLKATQDSAVLEALDLELGDLRGRGRAKIGFDASTHVEANLAVNRLALAPWLEPQSKGGKGGDFVLPSNIAAKLDLAVQLVEADGGPYRDVKLAASLAKGEIRVANATMHAPGGGSVSLDGTLFARRGKPAFDGDLEARFDHLRGFLDALKVDVADVPAERLLKASFQSKVKSDGDKIELLDFDAKIDETNLRGGVVVQPGARLGIGATLDIDRLDLEAYLPRQSRSSGLKKKTEGGWDSWDANFRLRIAALGFGGTEARGLTFDGTLQSGAIAVRELAARELLGAAVKLSGAITKLDTGTPSFAIERLEAKHGAADITGSGRFDFGGARPVLTARLAVGDLKLDFEGSSSGTRWPRENFDLSALDALDADVVLEGTSISHAHWHVEKPRVAAALKNGAATVSEFSGQLYGGSFRMAGTLVPGETPQWRTQIRVSNANLAAAFFGTGQNAIDLTAGNIDLEADLRASGQSAWDLVSSLSGSAKVAMRDGVIKGLDLPAVSRRLKEVNDPFDLLGLELSFAGGSSKLDSFIGNFNIEDGVIRTTDLTIAAPSGAGLVTGGADIANWTMYSALEFRFVDIPDAPIVLVTFTELLDAPQPTIYSDNLKDWVIRKGLGQSTKAPAPLPAKPAPPPPAAKPAAPPPSDGKDLTRGLLDGLKP